MESHPQGEAPSGATDGAPPPLAARFPAGWIIEGFQTKRLNQVYSLNPQIGIGGRPTYWDQAGQLFMYYQDDEQRWAICPVFDEGEDLLVAVQGGSNRGLAFEEDFGVWSEYLEDQERWATKRLRLTKLPEPSRGPQGTPARVPHLPVPAAAAAAVPPLVAASAGAGDTPGAAIPGEASAAAPGAVAEAAEASAQAREAPAEALQEALVARQGAGGPRGGGVVPSARRFLEENPHIEEVLIFKGPKRARLVLRFRGAQDAGSAAAVSQQLLRGCRPLAVEPIGAAQFAGLRQECERWKRPPRAAAPRAE